jgi:two-component system sensor histidine kinase DesK
VSPSTGGEGQAGASTVRHPAEGGRPERLARRVVLFGLPWLVIPLAFITPGAAGGVLVEVAVMIIMGVLWAVLVLRGSLSSAQRWLGIAALGGGTLFVDVLLGPGWGVVAVFTTTAAAWALPRRSALAVIGTWGVISVFGLLRDGTAGGKLLDVLLPVVIGLGMVALVEFLDLVELVRQQQEDLATMAVLTERNRIARDLHDSLGHSLAAVLVQVRLLRARMAAIEGEHVPAMVDSLVSIEAAVREAASDVRQTIADYRSFDVFTLLSSVPSTLRAAGVTVRVDAQPRALERLRGCPRVADALGWVLREGATNVLRHSAARSASITIREVDRGQAPGGGAMELLLHNDGIMPSDAVDASPGGSGVMGMRARMDHIGGTLEVESSGDAFTLIARAPLRLEEGIHDDHG